MSNTEIKCIELQFSKIGNNEVSSHIKIPLGYDWNKQNSEYFMLKINGREPQKYNLIYRDAGTVYHSRMKGRVAVSGELVNVSINCGDPNRQKEFAIINVVGSIDNGIADLYLFINPQSNSYPKQ